MFILTALAFLPKLILGFSIAHLVWADQRISSLLLKFFLGIPLGMGTASFLLFFSKWAALDGQTYIFIELSIVAAACTAMLLIRGNPFKKVVFDVDTKIITQNKAVLLLLAAAIVISIAGFFITVLLYPHGREDAWSNWNLVARFIYYSNDISNAVNYISSSSFPGYPFMLGLDVASGWIYLTSVTTRVPIIVAALFTFSIPPILFFGLLKNKGIQIAAIATIIVAGPWLLQGTTLMADVPLAAYYLSAAVLISFYYSEEEAGLAALAGVFAGFTGWVKNDGLPFTLITFMVMLLISLRKKDASGILRFAMGMAIPVIVIVTYHQFLAAPGNIVAGPNDMLPRLLDMSRFQTVLVFFIQQTYYFGSPANAYAITLLAILLIGGIDTRNVNALFSASIFLLQYAVYFAVYLITPLDLTWHLNTSMPRVFSHIAPLLAFAVFSLLRAQNFSLFKPGSTSATSTPTAE